MTSVIHYFNWVDYTIIGIVLFSTIISLFRGFLREAISLVVWGIGILLSLKCAGSVQEYLSSWIASSTVRYWVAFLSIFFIIFLIGILINIFVHKLVKESGFNVPDHFLGFFFGAARGLLIAMVFLMYLSADGIKDDTALAHSRFMPEVKPVVSWLHTFLPQQVKRASEWVLGGPDNKPARGQR